MPKRKRKKAKLVPIYLHSNEGYHHLSINRYMKNTYIQSKKKVPLEEKALTLGTWKRPSEEGRFELSWRKLSKRQRWMDESLPCIAPHWSHMDPTWCCFHGCFWCLPGCEGFLWFQLLALTGVSTEAPPAPHRKARQFCLCSFSLESGDVLLWFL